MKRILLATALAGVLAVPAAFAEGMHSKNNTQSQSLGHQNYSASEQTSGAGIQNPEHVRDVQQALSQKGFNPGEIDGVWGSRTASAIREFQKQQGLDATGSLNPQTASALGIDAGADADSMNSSGTSGGRVSEEPSSRFDSTDTEASGSGSSSER